MIITTPDPCDHYEATVTATYTSVVNCSGNGTTITIVGGKDYNSCLYFLYISNIHQEKRHVLWVCCQSRKIVDKLTTYLLDALITHA